LGSVCLCIGFVKDEVDLYSDVKTSVLSWGIPKWGKMTYGMQEHPLAPPNDSASACSFGLGRYNEFLELKPVRGSQRSRSASLINARIEGKVDGQRSSPHEQGELDRGAHESEGVEGEIGQDVVVVILDKGSRKPPALIQRLIGASKRLCHLQRKTAEDPSRLSHVRGLGETKDREVQEVRQGGRGNTRARNVPVRTS
jgi:hypothetical protein